MIAREAARVLTAGGASCYFTGVTRIVPDSVMATRLVLAQVTLGSSPSPAVTAGPSREGPFCRLPALLPAGLHPPLVRSIPTPAAR